MRMLENNKKFYGWLNGTSRPEPSLPAQTKYKFPPSKRPRISLYCIAVRLCICMHVSSRRLDHKFAIQPPPNRFKQVNVCKTLLRIIKKKISAFTRQTYTKYHMQCVMRMIPCFMWWNCYVTFGWQKKGSSENLYVWISILKNICIKFHIIKKVLWVTAVRRGVEHQHRALHV